MREVLSVGCSHTSCITSLSFHGGGKRTSCYTSLEHGAKDDLSLGFKWALVALVSCQLLQMSMPYFLPCSHFLHATCTAHSQDISC